MTDKITTSTFEVRKDNWSETRVVEETLAVELAGYELLFRDDVSSNHQRWFTRGRLCPPTHA